MFDEKLLFIHSRRSKSAVKKATRFTSHLILNSVLKSYKRSEKGQKGATIRLVSGMSS